jgi:hypothetical protein
MCSGAPMNLLATYKQASVDPSGPIKNHSKISPLSLEPPKKWGITGGIFQSRKMPWIKCIVDNLTNLLLGGCKDFLQQKRYPYIYKFFGFIL